MKPMKRAEKIRSLFVSYQVQVKSELLLYRIIIERKKFYEVFREEIEWARSFIILVLEMNTGRNM